MIFKRRIQDVPNGPTTFIAPSTTIVGTITGQGPYVFCGTVEGDCDINGPLHARGGRPVERYAEGYRRGRRRDRRGRRGCTPARRDLGTARVTGSLSGNSIAVAEGAVIEGEIRVTSGAQPVTFQEKRET